MVLFIDFSVLVCNFAEAKRPGDYSAGSVVDSAKELREETYSGKSRGSTAKFRLQYAAKYCQHHFTFFNIGWNPLPARAIGLSFKVGRIARLSEPRQRFFRLVFAIATDDV